MQIRILVADDDGIHQLVVCRALESAGYLVDSAWNGSEAVQACANHDYDLVLMDWYMPELDGCDATRLIRQLQRRQPVIIGSSGSCWPEVRETWLSAGLDGYLEKPYRAASLLALVREKTGTNK